MECATNQCVLPHVIVVLNKSNSALGEEAYDTEAATRRLLSDANQSLTLNPDIDRHVQIWQQGHDKTIKTAEDLLKCYYSTFRVVRVPEKGRYMLIDQQIRKLQTEISLCCRGSHRRKLQARRDLKTDELGECIQNGLDHFTASLDVPFDFLAFSWSQNPIPPGLEGNILRLALLIRSTQRNFKGQNIFQHLSQMVASCIMLHYIRHRIRGMGYLMEIMTRFDTLQEDHWRLLNTTSQLWMVH